MNRNTTIALVLLIVLAAAGIVAYNVLSSPEPDSFKDVGELKAGDYVEAEVTTVSDGKTDTGTYRMEILSAADGMITFRESYGTAAPKDRTMDLALFAASYYDELALSDDDRRSLEEESADTDWKVADTAFGEKKVIVYRIELTDAAVELMTSNGGNAIYEHRISEPGSTVTAVLKSTNMFV